MLQLAIGFHNFGGLRRCRENLRNWRVRISAIGATVCCNCAGEGLRLAWSRRGRSARAGKASWLFIVVPLSFRVSWPPRARRIRLTQGTWVRVRESCQGTRGRDSAFGRPSRAACVPASRTAISPHIQALSEGSFRSRATAAATSYSCDARRRKRLFTTHQPARARNNLVQKRPLAESDKSHPRLHPGGWPSTGRSGSSASPHQPCITWC